MAKHWETEPPLIYQLQLQHQLMVAGVRPGYLLASIGGQPPVWAELMRDGEICGILRSTYARFWESVVADRDLPCDYKGVTSKAITARYPEGEGETIKLGDDALLWWKNRQRAADSKKSACELYGEATNNLKQMMGDAWYAVLSDETTLSLKPNKKGQRILRLIGEEEDGERDAWGGL
jgi:predicted phage-related endonuclease